MREFPISPISPALRDLDDGTVRWDRLDPNQPMDNDYSFGMLSRRLWCPPSQYSDYPRWNQPRAWAGKSKIFHVVGRVTANHLSRLLPRVIWLDRRPLEIHNFLSCVRIGPTTGSSGGCWLQDYCLILLEG